MKKAHASILSILIILIFTSTVSAQPPKRFDTAMKYGKAGYKLFCSNKSADMNNVAITPTGFEKEAREANINIKGRINKAEIDDFNNDGFPDIVLYINNPGDKGKVSIVSISSDENKGLRPIFFPDIYDDPKLKIGYQGYDQFSLIEGTLMRRFPLYRSVDSVKVEPTGMIRQIQYKVGVGDRGELKFKVARSYDFAKQ